MKSCGPGYKIDCPAIAAIDDCLVIEPQFQLFWICDCLPYDFAGVRKPPLVLESRIVAFDYYFSFLGVHFFFAPYFSSMAAGVHFFFAPCFCLGVALANQACLAKKPCTLLSMHQVRPNPLAGECRSFAELGHAYRQDPHL